MTSSGELGSRHVAFWVQGREATTEMGEPCAVGSYWQGEADGRGQKASYENRGPSFFSAELLVQEAPEHPGPMFDSKILVDTSSPNGPHSKKAPSLQISPSEKFTVHSFMECNKLQRDISWTKIYSKVNKLPLIYLHFHVKLERLE